MSPWVEERALAFAIHVIRWFSEYTSTGCLGASKEFVDRRDTKCDGVRCGALLCRRSGVSVDAGFGDDDGPIAVQELPAILGVAETFGEWKGRCEPRDGFGHVGVVEHGYYGGVWCRAVFLQHGLVDYEVLPWSSNETEISHGRGFVARLLAFTASGAVGFIDCLGRLKSLAHYVTGPFVPNAGSK